MGQARYPVCWKHTDVYPDQIRMEEVLARIGCRTSGLKGDDYGLKDQSCTM